MTTKDDMARLLSAVASFANHMTLLATHAPAGKWAYERSSAPRPGDLVAEMTHREWTPACIGWLVKIADEPMYASDEWDEAAEGRPIPTDTYYYVQPLTGGPMTRWYNCRMVALPSAERGENGPGHWGEDMPSAIAWHQEWEREHSVREPVR